MCPGFGVVEILGFSCHGDDAVAFELYRREPSELAVATLAVVPDLEVLEHRVGEFESGVPLLPVQKLDLHSRPERLDHGVVVAVADTAHRSEQPGVLSSLGEGPRTELDAVIGVNDRSRPGLLVQPAVDGHPECVGDQRAGR